MVNINLYIIYWFIIVLIRNILNYNGNKSKYFNPEPRDLGVVVETCEVPQLSNCCNPYLPRFNLLDSLLQEVCIMYG